MSDPQRLSRARAKADQSGGSAQPAHTKPAVAGPAAPWAARRLPAPFALGGVQRKVTIGPAADAYEREADRVANDVASGRPVAQTTISPIGSLPGAPAAKPARKFRAATARAAAASWAAFVAAAINCPTNSNGSGGVPSTTCLSEGMGIV